VNNIAIFFFLVNATAILFLPKRLAPIPLLVGTCYMTLSQGIELGPFTFTIIRMLILVGILRILIRSERLKGGMNGLDWLMVIWGFLALISSFFRSDVSAAFVWRMGLAFNTWGIYFLIRVFCQSIDDLWGLILFIALILCPIAFEMIYENLANYNLFSFLGGVPSIPVIRDGNIRAQGPFRHPILAGTVGAICLPLMIALWNKHPKAAVVGIFSCVTIVFNSSSSGPIASALAGIGALFLWPYRHKMKFVRRVALTGYIALELIMKAPAYYLMARIPIVQASTGWHRARLIQSAFSHLNEWWLAGTEYTRHWMPTGVSWSPNHADITNHYIQMGISGGLLVMLMFIATLAKGFSYIGKILQAKINHPVHTKFMIWALGASLFANATTMISVSYFDQSFIFLYLTLAIISSTWSWTKANRTT